MTPQKNTWAIILAAGQSKRMGTPKMMLRHKGKTLIHHVIDAAVNSKADGVIIVINPEVDGLLAEASVPGVSKVFLNDQSDSGLSMSMKSGLYVLPSEAEAAIFLLGDQPLVTTREIDLLLEEFQGNQAYSIYQSSYRGKKGHPVLFQRSMFDRLLDVKGDKGGREVIRQFSGETQTVEMGRSHPFDIDTKDDYRRLLRKEVS
ncbi:molybdenum cofactor cytidylyltransferase [Fictibacillus enclensis]|nr:nucleotidyltransferase family protein [Fictibacillus enclensis]SCC29210.1 molybdenum cofactor cytidylyltransferase [Fictibacillus enclensis]